MDCMETRPHQLQVKTAEDNMRSEMSLDWERKRQQIPLIFIMWLTETSSGEKERTTTSVQQRTCWFLRYFIELYFYCFCLNHLDGWLYIRQIYLITDSFREAVYPTETSPFKHLSIWIIDVISFILLVNLSGCESLIGPPDGAAGPKETIWLAHGKCCVQVLWNPRISFICQTSCRKSLSFQLQEAEIIIGLIVWDGFLYYQITTSSCSPGDTAIQELTLKTDMIPPSRVSFGFSEQLSKASLIRLPL